MSDPEENMVPVEQNPAALERAARRELALEATEAVREVLEVDVTVAGLIKIAEAEEETSDRLIARRALRCIASIALEDSELARKVGPAELYHYAEAVINYGASNKRYLQLIETFGLSAEEATGIYALRELLADHTDGKIQGLPSIIAALTMVGMSVRQAGQDPDEALSALYEAGFITDHVSHLKGDRTIVVQYDAPVFYPSKGPAVPRLVEDDTDGTITQGIIEGLKSDVSGVASEEDEVEVWRRAAVDDYLKNLGS